MVYKHFNIAVLVRVFLLIGSAFFVGLSFSLSNKLLYICLGGVFLILAVWNLITFMNRTNHKINFFIQAVKNDDTTLRFPSKTGNKIINELHGSLNELNHILQQAKIKSQIQEKYFSEILQNIGTAVLVYNDKGFITDVNQASLEVFGLNTLTHIAQFDKVDKNFRRQLEELKGGEKRMLSLKKKNEEIQLISRCSTIQLKDETVKLLTLQDIRGELERKEIDSWVKLIRVLSHEIMNSLTPVTSISQSLIGLWKEALGADDICGDELVENSIKGLEVIGERSEALIRFVQSYRKLTQVPKLQKKNVHIIDLFDSLNILIMPYKEESTAMIKFHTPENNFSMEIDEQMFIQVLINLIKNALEAMSSIYGGEVHIIAEQSDTTVFKIVDNGPGIPTEIKDSIFIPFFTTKEKGTGVGLSYSRQIIKAHGGTIFCNSTSGETMFEVIV